MHRLFARRRRLPLQRHAVATAVLAAVGGGAGAQTAPADAGQLQTITVTAERRTENVQQVPNSVSVVPSELLDVLNTSGQDVRMLSGRVPSLNIESSFGRAFPRFYIRGYGNTDFRLNASQPVSLVYDDVVQENPILKGFPAVRPGAGRSAARAAGLAVRPQHAGGRGQVRVDRARAGQVRGLRQRLGRHLHDDQPRRRAERAHRRRFGAAPVADEPDAQGLGGQHLRRRARRRSSRATATARCACSGCSSRARTSSALVNVHARDYDGSARLFRANIIQPGTNDLVAGFDPKKISHRRQERAGAAEPRRQPAPALGPGADAGAALDHRLRARQDLQPRRHRRRLRRARLARHRCEPGFIPFASETADGMPKHSQWTQEFRLESDTKTAFDWQAGVFLFKEDYKVESFSYDSTRRQRAGRLRARAPEERRLGRVRQPQLRRAPRAEAARRPALHAWTRRSSASRST